MGLPKTVVDKFYSEANAAYTELKSREELKIITHYIGDLSADFANALSARVEKSISGIIDKKRIQKKFFLVFIEAIQNIRIHGEADIHDHIHSVVTVFQINDELCARFSNIIKSESAEALRKRIDMLNEMGEKEVKELYLEVMQNGSRSDKGGAGLGVITMVMRSKNPCEYELLELSDSLKLFRHSVCIDLV